jgi:hypothetical protein
VKDDETKKEGIAECASGHRWKCQWHVKESKTLTGLVRMERIVIPRDCPEPLCSKRWSTVRALLQ